MTDSFCTSSIGRRGYARAVVVSSEPPLVGVLAIEVGGEGGRHDASIHEIAPVFSLVSFLPKLEKSFTSRWFRADVPNSNLTRISGLL